MTAYYTSVVGLYLTSVSLSPPKLANTVC